MGHWKNEAEAREQIKALVADYYHVFKEKKEILRTEKNFVFILRFSLDETSFPMI